MEMNKRGYTLVEVIVSIMILSIASITLAGAFSKVIHFMSKSNDVKNASNSIYAYAEGDSSIENIQTIDSRNTSYKIENIEVKGTFLEMKSPYSDDISLKVVLNDSVPLLKDNEDYITLMYKISNEDKNDLINGIQDLLSKITGNYDVNLDVATLFLETGLGEITFPSKLLPMSMTTLRSSPSYVRVAFPWQEKNFSSHGQALIFATNEYDREVKSKTDLYMVYFNDTWYSYDTKGLPSPYYLDSDQNILRLYKVDENGIKKELTHEEFKKEVLNAQDNNQFLWKKISPNARFDGEDSSEIWK